MATVPVVAAYLIALPTPSARAASRSVIRVPVELGVQPLGHALGPQPALRVVGKPPEREQREVALRDDVGVVTRAPQLGERRVLPGRRLDSSYPRVQGEQRGSRHAVLQAGPGCPPQRLRAHWHSLVERADSSSEGQDLLPRDPESRFPRARHELRNPMRYFSAVSLGQCSGMSPLSEGAWTSLLRPSVSGTIPSCRRISCGRISRTHGVAASLSRIKSSATGTSTLSSCRSLGRTSSTGGSIRGGGISTSVSHVPFG